MSTHLVAGSIVMGDQSATLSHWSISRGHTVTFKVDPSSVVTLDAPTALDCISLVFNGTTTTYAILDGSLDAGSVTIAPEAQHMPETAETIEQISLERAYRDRSSSLAAITSILSHTSIPTARELAYIRKLTLEVERLTQRIETATPEEALDYRVMCLEQRLGTVTKRLDALEQVDGHAG